MKRRLQLLRERRARSEAGETLIEALMSSALMALVVVAVIGAVATIVIGARIHQAQAEGNTSLVATVEQLRSQQETPRVCAANDAGHPYRAALPSGVTMTSIEYQTMTEDVSGNSTLSWSTALTDCSLSSPLTLQRITLQYANADSSVESSLSLFKGKY